MTGARLVRGLTVTQVYVGSKPARPAKTHRGVEQWLARQAHILKVVGSNPTSAIKTILRLNKE